MNTARLLEHFDRVAEAPGAVPRLRRFILDLAVRGKLVEQAAGEEPAKELLRRVSASPSTDTSQDFKDSLVRDVVLPTSWVWARFSVVAAIESNLVAPDSYPDLPHIAPDNIESRSGRLLPYTSVKESKVASPKHLFSAGVILYSKIRPALAKATAVDFTGLCSADMYPVRSLIGRSYLLAFMLSDLFVNQSLAQANRVAMPKINRSGLASIFVAVPPLGEQDRIASRLDELMALCDRLEAGQAERETRRNRVVVASATALRARSTTESLVIPTAHALELVTYRLRRREIEAVRQMVVSLAVRGDLTAGSASPQWTRRSRKTPLPEADTRHSEPRRNPGRSVPYSVPPSWVWTSTEQACDAIIDCPHSTPTFVSTGVACLDTNCFKNGKLILSKIRYVTDATYEERVQRLTPRAGDVVFAREGSVGEWVIVPAGLRCCLGQRVMLFRPGATILPRYFALALSEQSSLRRLEALHKGIGARHVNVGDMRQALLPLPPVHEQHIIVSRVDELFGVCDRLEAQLLAGEVMGSQLLDALLHEALHEKPVQPATVL
jgi:type I restriction enzyme S subunit